MLKSTSVIKLLSEMLEGIVTGYGSPKKELFENHVQPLMKKIQVIHKDYIIGFTEFRHHLIKRIKPSRELLDFLKERRRDYPHVRQSTRDIAEKVRKLQELGMKGSDMMALEAFSGAIVEYFFESSEAGASSWYSDLLEIVRWQSRFDDEIIPDVWQTTSIAEYAPDDFLEVVDLMLNKELPSAFRKVSDAYANLRVQFR